MQQNRWKRRLVGAACALSLTLVGGAPLAGGCAHSVVFALLDPGDAFVLDDVPPAPDYREARAWAALPETVDEADVALDALPAVEPSAARADVFYVHPTTWLGRQWSAPFDSDDVIEATARGGTLIQASAFNGCCAVFAPRYRQANGKAITEPSRVGDRAMDVAYGDVQRAFDHFLGRTPEGRPFFVAAHSQGSVLAARLLRERFDDAALRGRLVAAYIVFGPIGAADIDGRLPVCASPTQTGCVVGFNARGPDFVPNSLAFQSPLGSDHPPMAGRLCVNPVTWRADDGRSSQHEHQGALFFDTEHPRVLPGLLTSQCKGGTLEVRGLGELPERRFVDDALLWIMGEGNYHPIEYQLFCVDLRKNAAARLTAFLQAAAHEPDEEEPHGDQRP